jgi:hypothetical protein
LRWWEFKPPTEPFFALQPAAAQPLSSRRLLALQPLASQRWRVKPTAGDYAPRYETPQNLGWGGTGQADESACVKHPSTRARGVLKKRKLENFEMGQMANLKIYHTRVKCNLWLLVFGKLFSFSVKGNFAACVMKRDSQ